MVDGSIILKVLLLCEELCEKVVCVKELCVKKCEWKSCAWKIVCDKAVCERLCVCVTKLCEKWCVWQSCVWKIVCDKVVKSCVWKSCVWQSCVWVTKLCVTKMCVREKLHVREMCVKDCVCDKVVGDKVVCERDVWKSCVRKSCVWQRLCVTKLCVCVTNLWVTKMWVTKVCVCVWQSCGWQSLCERDVCDKVVCERVVFDKVVRDKAAFEREMWKIVRDKVVCVWQGCIWEKWTRLQCGCHQVPRLSRKTKVHVAKCHTCHAKRPRAQQLLQKILCTAPATRKPATRAASPPEGSVHCACHTKASRGPAAATRAAAPPEGSVYGAWEPCVVWVGLWAGCCVMSWCESHVWCEMWEAKTKRCGGGRAEAAAGAKRKTRTPHSDVGKTVNSYKCAKLIRCYLLWDLWLLSIQLSNVASPRPIIPKNWPRNIWVVFGIASGSLT